MAKNLNEYYLSKGQALPSVAERQGVATQAGITGYKGTAEQNGTLLGYLQNTPSSNNVITSDSLVTPPKLNSPDVKVDNAPTGMNSSISSLLKNLNSQVTTDQTTYDSKAKDVETSILASGDTGANTEKIIKDNGVDVLKRQSDSLSSEIEAEQKQAIDQIKQLKNNPEGLTTSALNARINDLQSKSADKIANLGIGLSAVNRQYETASNIANRAITANADRLKADLESKKFVLDQLGTKLATEKSNAFTLQIKQIDNEADLVKSAIKTATDGMAGGSINSDVGAKALQDLVSGKISLSDFYKQLGTDSSTQTGSDISGYDITSYATDPKHEQKVLSIYNTIGNISNVAEADAQIKSLSPNSPITGKMVIDASEKYGVDPKLMLALMQQDSSMGTAGLAVKTKNAGNVGNDDAGNTQTFKNWGEGVDAVAKWLSTHKAPEKKTYAQYGLLSNTSFNPSNDVDKKANDYLDAYFKSPNGALPTPYTILGTRNAKNTGLFSSVQDRAKSLYFEATGESLPDLAVLTANKKLINENNKVLNKNEIASETVAKNFDLAIQGEMTNDVNQNATIINKILNPIYLALGDPAVNQALVSNGTISQEFANLISIRNAQGTTVADKEMANELIRFGTSVEAQKAVAERLKAEASNIHTALQEQNSKLYQTIDPLQLNPNNPNRGVGNPEVSAQFEKLGMTDAGENKLLIPRSQWTQLTNTHDKASGKSQADALLALLASKGYTLLVK